jgi:hypothetical protein
MANGGATNLNTNPWKNTFAFNSQHKAFSPRIAQRINAKTTGLYDRRNDDISVSEGCKRSLLQWKRF